MFLIVYVDDFKMSGRCETMVEGWKRIRAGIKMDDPTEVGRFLGCKHELSTQKVKWQGMEMTDLDPPPPKAKKTTEASEQMDFDPRKIEAENIAKRTAKDVRVIEYDMSDFFKSCVALYADLTGTDPKDYPMVPTPFGPAATEIEYALGGASGRSCAPAEEALADLLGVPRPQEPTMKEVMEASGLEYERRAMDAAAAAIGFQAREKVGDDLAVHVRYLTAQNNFVAYESKADPRWASTTRRVTYDMKGNLLADDDNISSMTDAVKYRSLPKKRTDIKVML